MKGLEIYKEIFTDKLQKTGSFDAAFLKVVWKAYIQGREDALNDLTQEPSVPKWTSKDD